jgi:hypothetical protein
MKSLAEESMHGKGLPVIYLKKRPIRAVGAETICEIRCGDYLLIKAVMCRSEEVREHQT